MKYPTLEEVEKADREQLCRWWRFLSSPEELTPMTLAVLSRLTERFNEVGGFNTAISKKIGWIL